VAVYEILTALEPELPEEVIQKHVCSTQYQFGVFKNVDCFMSLRTRYLDKAVTLLFGNSHWWSLEAWSRSRDESRSQSRRFQVSSRSRRFQVSSRSRRFQVSRLWILQRNGLWKFLYFNDLLFVVFTGKKQPKHVGKMSEIWKKLKSEGMTTFFKKFRQNAQILKSRVSVSEFLMKSRSRLEILTRSRSRLRITGNSTMQRCKGNVGCCLFQNSRIRE